MKHLFFLFSIALLSFTACKKTDKETKVDVKVTDPLGVPQSNITVYQISDYKYQTFGADVSFRDHQNITASDGIASFIIKEVDYIASEKNTYHFFCNYTTGNNHTIKTAVQSVTIKKGDSRTITLKLN